MRRFLQALICVTVTEQLCDRIIQLECQGKGVCKTVVRPAMRNAAETWVAKESAGEELGMAEMMMVRWMCGVQRT